MNEQAKKWFKNKLRYIIARWGYSTNILSYELFNEIEQSFLMQRIDNSNTENPYYRLMQDNPTPGFLNLPFENSKIISNKVKYEIVKWVDEMTAYLKSLDKKHLVTVGTTTPWIKDIDYKNNPDNNDINGASFSFQNLLPPNPNSDYVIENNYLIDRGKNYTPRFTNGIYKLPNIDYINYHIYRSFEDRDRYYATHIKLLNEQCNKPVFATEASDDNYHEYSVCSEMDYYNFLWTSLAIGSAGAPVAFNIPTDDNIHENLNPMGNLLLNNLIDFSKNVYSCYKLTNYTGTTPIFTINENISVTNIPKAYEVFFSKNGDPIPVNPTNIQMYGTNSDYSFGWLHNRSFYNRNHQGECDYKYPNVPFENCNISPNYSMCDLISSNYNKNIEGYSLSNNAHNFILPLTLNCNLPSSPRSYSAIKDWHKYNFETLSVSSPPNTSSSLASISNNPSQLSNFFNNKLNDRDIEPYPSDNSGQFDYRIGRTKFNNNSSCFNSGTPNYTGNNNLWYDYPFPDLKLFALPTNTNNKMNLEGFLANKSFNIKWYRTNKNGLGDLYTTQTNIFSDNNGVITGIIIPTTDATNPDFFFKITLTPPSYSRLATIKQEKEKNIYNSMLELSPNPNNGIFNINISKVSVNENDFIQVNVFDSKGNLIYNHKTNDNSKIIDIDISNKASGIYLVTVSTSYESFNKKVVKN